MLERLFSLFFSVLNGIALTDFFIGVMAAGFLFGMATLIRYICWRSIRVNWLYVIILIAGIGFILYQIFLNSGGNAKFKSDLPEGIKVKSKRKRVVMVACSLILCVISLVLLIALLISLLS